MWRLKSLEDDNRCLKSLVGNLSLDIQILQYVLRRFPSPVESDAPSVASKRLKSSRDIWSIKFRSRSAVRISNPAHSVLQWQKPLFENGEKAFEPTGNQQRKTSYEQKIDKLKSKLVQKNEVLAELLEEHVKLKKILGNSKRTMGFPRHPR